MRGDAAAGLTAQRGTPAGISEVSLASDSQDARAFCQLFAFNRELIQKEEESTE